MNIENSEEKDNETPEERIRKKMRVVNKEDLDCSKVHKVKVRTNQIISYFCREQAREPQLAEQDGGDRDEDTQDVVEGNNILNFTE